MTFRSLTKKLSPRGNNNNNNNKRDSGMINLYWTTGYRILLRTAFSSRERRQNIPDSSFVGSSPVVTHLRLHLSPFCRYIVSVLRLSFTHSCQSSLPTFLFVHVSLPLSSRLSTRTVPRFSNTLQWSPIQYDDLVSIMSQHRITDIALRSGQLLWKYIKK